MREEASISKYPRSFFIGRKLATSVGDGWDGMEGMQRRVRGGNPRVPRMRETGGAGPRWNSLSSGEIRISPQGQVALESFLSLLLTSLALIQLR